MKVLVIGSGLIGVTTAYCLRRRGHEVTVIDRQAGPGLETSFANGALLTPSMPEPWNAPGSWRVLLSSLARSDSPLQLRLRALPGLAGWGIGFLRQSNRRAFERNTLRNLRLALYSLKVMETLRQQAGIEYGRTARGTLRIFRDAGALDRVAAGAERLRAEGLGCRRLSTEALLALEPALTPIASDLRGAMHYESDETGDAYRFCVALAEQAGRLGVRFRFHTEISSIGVRSGEVTAVWSGEERFVADQYVVAAASYSTPLLKRIGVDLAVRPAKGYSVSFDHPGNGSLRIPVVDDALHAVVVPLEGAIRVAGTAEFAGYDLSLPEARIRNLMTLLCQVLPKERFDPSAARSWCGLRAMSVDGVPIIGRTPLANLLVNTGHGHLGWTMAAGSAQLLSDLMSGNAPGIDPVPYSLARIAAPKRPAVV